MNISQRELQNAVKAALGINGPASPYKVTEFHKGLNFKTRMVTMPSGTTLGIKKPRQTLLSTHLPHRFLGTLLVEDQMAQEQSALQAVRSHGVCLVTTEPGRKPKLSWLPSLASPLLRMCLVYEFRGDLHSLKQLLARNEDLQSVTRPERVYLGHIARALATRHAKKPRVRGRQRVEFYNMTLTHLLEFAGGFMLNGRKSFFLGPRRTDRLTLLIIRTLRKWLDHGERIGMLVGDLQPGNILLNAEDNDVLFIDLSRFPWGEARGFDVGWLMAEFLWDHCRTGNPRHRKIGSSFLVAYEQASGDTRLREALLIGLGIKALVLLRLPPNKTAMSQRRLRRFYSKVLSLLQRGRFTW